MDDVAARDVEENVLAVAIAKAEKKADHAHDGGGVGEGETSGVPAAGVGERPPATIGSDR